MGGSHTRLVGGPDVVRAVWLRSRRCAAHGWPHQCGELLGYAAGRARRGSLAQLSSDLWCRAGTACARLWGADALGTLSPLCGAFSLGTRSCAVQAQYANVDHEALRAK